MINDGVFIAYIMFRAFLIYNFFSISWYICELCALENYLLQNNMILYNFVTELHQVIKGHLSFLNNNGQRHGFILTIIIPGNQ